MPVLMFKLEIFITYFSSIPAILALLISLAGCGINDSPSGSARTGSRDLEAVNVNFIVHVTPSPSARLVDKDLENSKQTWREKEIASYDVVASLYVGGVKGWPEPVLVQVRDGAATAIKSIPESDQVSIEGYKEFDTVEKMFEAIQKGLDGEADVEVKYNKEYGYPEELYINYFKRGSDHGKRLVVKKFEVIQ